MRLHFVDDDISLPDEIAAPGMFQAFRTGIGEIAEPLAGVWDVRPFSATGGTRTGLRQPIVGSTESLRRDWGDGDLTWHSDLRFRAHGLRKWGISVLVELIQPCLQRVVVDAFASRDFGPSITNDGCLAPNARFLFGV